MKVTIWEDPMGSLHIFRGYNRKLIRSGKYMMYDRNGKPAEVFLQFQSDIEELKNTLSKQKCKDLENGYEINAIIDDNYFQ